MFGRFEKIPIIFALCFVIGFVAISITFQTIDYNTKFDHYRDDVVTVTNNTGGEIWSHYNEYTKMRLENKKLRIGGVCVSACTFFMGLIPPDRVCATNYSYFGFHSIQTEMGPVPEYSKAFFPLVYPNWLLDEFKTRGWDWEVEDVPNELAKLKVLWLSHKELNIQDC